MFKDLIQTVGLLLLDLLFFLEILKKKALKMTSWSFSELFYFFIFRPPHP